MNKNLLTLINEFKSGAISLVDAERIITLLIENRERLDRELSNLTKECNKLKDGIDAARYRKLRAKNWSEGGVAVVEKSSSVKLGHICLSHEQLDAALDAEL